MEILRNLYRRRLRTSLTVLGIAVGILAFTVMGGMAEKINLIIRGSEAFFSHRIAVRPSSSNSVKLLSANDIATVRQVPGVKAVEAQIMLPFDETEGFELTPRFVVGVNLPDFLAAQLMAGPEAQLRLRQGRWWQPGQQNVTVLGGGIAKKMKKNVGDTIETHQTSLKVVGILEETLSLPDGWAIVPQEDARALMLGGSGKDDLLRFLGLGGGFATNAYALVEPNQGDAVTGVIAEKLRRGFLLYSPQKLTTAAGQASTILNTTIYGSAAIAILVGALSVINTMFIAVGERTREIGIKKAIGATKGDILREYLAESTVIGFLGGLLGAGLGGIVIAGINLYTVAHQGTPVFVLTVRLVFWALGFSSVLGAVAGILPAVRAASLDPVKALGQV